MLVAVGGGEVGSRGWALALSTLRKKKIKSIK